MKQKELTYEAAAARLEHIVAGFENNELGIEQLGEQLKEAQRLLKFCQERLVKVENDVKQILENGQR